LCADYTILFVVICPLCGTRKARRGCPAVGQQICAVCCGTKRLVQIRCPADCAWLASAREHPPAAIVRQQQRDLGLFVQSMRDFNRRQSELFFLVNSFLRSYQPPALQPLVDEDVAEATSALASTYETASRGVIYEHRPASLPAERLSTALKPVLAEAGKGGGSAFERDAVVVLRRVNEAVREIGATDAANRRVYLDLLARVIPERSRHDDAGDRGDAQSAPPSRLILP
jgi:hypothetical protein